MSEEESPAEELRIENPAEDLLPDEEPGETDAGEEEPSFDVTSGEDLVEQLPSGSEIPSEVRRTFWESVLLLKIAIVTSTLAALFAYFRGQLLLAAGLGAVGLLAGARAIHTVRSFQRERE